MKTQEYTKLPPQATDLEEAVLGACLLEQGSLATAIDLLKPEHFYLPQHQTIFTAIVNLFKNNKAIDCLTVVGKLKEMGKLDEMGGIIYISQLTNKIASTAHIETHIYTIIEKYIARETNAISMFAVKESYEETKDVFELLDELQLKLLNLRNSTIKNKPVHIESISNENMEEISQRSKSQNKELGIQSGIKKVDEIVGGFMNGQKYIIAARPSQGKSSFVTSLIDNIAIKQRVPIALFSLEMTSKQVELRLKTIHTGISNMRLIKGEVYENEWEKLHDATKTISNAPIYIDGSSRLNTMELRSKAINLISRHGIKIIFIDYLQRMSSSDKNLKDQRLIINEISNATTILAKDLNIPVIELSQLSRSVELTRDKKPELSHLKESGNLEEDAYCVMFLYRPERYGFEYFPDEKTEIETANKAKVIVAKNRNGEVGECIINFDKQTMHFRDEVETFYQNYEQKKEQILITRKGEEKDFNDDF